MDTKKCRTCFTDLEPNDLYLKLNVIHKNSKLSLAGKLKLCIPTMDLRHAETLYICMQCSMHLETAYNFHMMCLKTEKQLKCLSNGSSVVANDTPNSRTDIGEKKMFCNTCNVSFVTKNIFDLHMKVMHSAEDATPTESVQCEEKLEEKKSRSKQQVRDTSPYCQLNLDDIRNSVKRKLEEIEENSESKKEKADTTKQMKLGRHLDGKFKKGSRKKPVNVNVKTISNHVRKVSENEISKVSATKTSATKSVSAKIAKDLIKTDKAAKDLVKTEKAAKDSIKTEKTAKDLIKANKTGKDSGLWKCRFCGKTFSAISNLTKHLTSIHKNACDLCKICERYYANSNEHRKMYGCQLQNYSSTASKDRYHFSYNLKVCYIPYGNRQVMCIICRAIYGTTSELISHISKTHKSTYHCKTCHKKFSGLNYCFHVGTGCDTTVSTPFFNYTSDGECICPLCDKIYPTSTTLAQHMSSHSEREFYCKKCSKRYRILSLYCKHIMACKKEQDNKTLFVTIEQESRKSKKTCTPKEEDPLGLDDSQVTEKPNDQSDDERSLIDVSQPSVRTEMCYDKSNLNKSVKIEPTELLDQSAFISNAETSKNGALLSNTSSDEYVNINEELMDSPDLVYILACDKPVTQ